MLDFSKFHKNFEFLILIKCFTAILMKIFKNKKIGFSNIKYIKYIFRIICLQWQINIKGLQSMSNVLTFSRGLSNPLWQYLFLN